MQMRSQRAITGLILLLSIQIIFTEPALAAPEGISNVENFIRSVIMALAGLAGLVATGFFVAGGFTYITSSGSPEKLDKAKRTIAWSAAGLAIVIASFVLASIVTSLASQAFGG